MDIILKLIFQTSLNYIKMVNKGYTMQLTAY